MKYSVVLECDWEGCFTIVARVRWPLSWDFWEGGVHGIFPCVGREEQGYSPKQELKFKELQDQLAKA